MKIDTALVRFAAAPGDPLHPAVTPLYQTATFCQPDATASGPYDYTRSGNPTRTVLEAQLARLEGAAHAFAFSSGMAALGAVARLVRAGDEILAGDDLYGGTWRLLDRVLHRCGVSVRFVDATDPSEVERAISRRTRLVLVEAPTNPLLRICDLRALATIAHRHGARLVVDGSLMGPLRQRPLDLGADLVVHSATKSLCGHGDVIAGVVATHDDALAREIAFVQNADGTALAPFDAWLLLRGTKTLSLRVERAERNARAVADALVVHPGVAEVYWPGLADHPGASLHASQASGPGPVVSFRTGSTDTSERVVNALRCFSIAVSFGGVASSVSLPCRQSHASIPDHLRRARGFPEDLVRLSIGIEDADDLVADVIAALDAAGGTTGAGRGILDRRMTA